MYETITIGKNTGFCFHMVYLFHLPRNKDSVAVGIRQRWSRKKLKFIRLRGEEIDYSRIGSVLTRDQRRYYFNAK